MLINNLMTDNKLDAFLVTSLVNIRYLSGFTGSDALVLICSEKRYIFVDSRYYEQTKKQAQGFIVILHSRSDLFEKINKCLCENQAFLVGYEGDRMVVDDYLNFKKKLHCELVNLTLNEIRMVKNAQEIALIKKACEITDLAFTHLISYVKVGMSEIDLNIELQKFILDKGAQGLSFETIVASGQRGSMPHGVASAKKIMVDDFVTIDFGVFYEGYCSDITRTFVMGNNPNQELQKIYEIVKEAQKKAIEAIKPGIMLSELDKIARDYIASQGYEEYFGHGLGHGIGLEIHELPFVNKTSLSVLEAGHIITIEPGIYFPELGGVRIEDDVLVTQNGYEILNNSTKELLKIDRR